MIQLVLLTTILLQSASAIQGSNGWNRTQSVSRIDDVKTISLSRAAQETPPGLSGPPNITVRCRGRSTELFIVTGTPPRPELGRPSKYSVRLRFDKQPPVTDAWDESVNDRALFAPKPRDVIRPMLTATTMLFEFTPWGQNPTVVEFNVAGLKDKIDEVATACDWAAQDAAQAAEKAAQDAKKALGGMTVSSYELNGTSVPVPNLSTMKKPTPNSIQVTYPSTDDAFRSFYDVTLKQDGWTKEDNDCWVKNDTALCLKYSPALFVELTITEK